MIIWEVTYRLSDLIDVIHSITQDSVKGQKPADVAYGTVISASPLSVQLQTTMQPIPAAALILTAGVIAKTAQVQGGQGGTVTINEGLAVGDKVLMLRVSKGQRFIVLSKV
ncbi:hypothetical protein B5E84_18080 [Lachnoclostridium sp. An14]|nr:hypothetical protein B5E84_18080 [Lachnoclostridium sp. An14]